MSDQSRPPDDRRPPSERVVEAVAAAFGTSPLDFEPTLYETVDPEALDSLVRTGPESLRIRFRYGECSVVVTGTGRVDVSPPDKEISTNDERL
ncbi:HalOD1 output domain-containing protein [Haloterrigena salinisoli]|uniref:HalOD1 output domain-containing protein n=1 Tax=Haloterrigena salinisoli TaxID=3132747 RepID=UPI0030D1ECD0